MELDDLDLLANLLDEDGAEDGVEEMICPPPATANRLDPSDSEIHKGDTDSSDDEDNKYFESSNYNSFGRSIKQKLKEIDLLRRDKSLESTKPWQRFANNSSTADGVKTFGSNETINDKIASTNFCIPGKSPAAPKGDVYTEPIFGIRLINPVISSAVLKEKMAGKVPIVFSKVKRHVAHGDLKTDWVIGGVIVSKSQPKVSQKGSKYMIWKLSDLKDKLFTVSMFLFGNSYSKLWKTTVGTVVGVLNPNVLDKNDKNSDEASLSIFNPDQVMIWGQSKDLGICRGKRKNGENCFNFVNKSLCEFCSHHVQAEYRKFTSRSELQASTCGGLVNLRNKVLGKNEVFYGGKSFTSVTPVNKAKVQQRDNTRLTKLGVEINVGPSPKMTPKLPHCPRSVELLRKLSEPANKNGEKQDENKNSPLLKTPNLSWNSPKLLDPKQIKSASLTSPALDKFAAIDFDMSPKQNNTTPTGDKKAVKIQQPKTAKQRLQNRFNALSNIASEVSRKVNKPNVEVKPLNGDTGVFVFTSPVQTKTSLSLSNTKNSFSGAEKQSLDKSVSPGTEVRGSARVHPSNKNGDPHELAPQDAKKNAPVVFKSPPLASIPKARVSSAKKKALAYVRQNGPINNDDRPGKGIKRHLESIGEVEPTQSSMEDERKEVLSERFIELMNRPAINPELIEYNDVKHLEEYYDKMEKKEQMEEKMLNTFKLACKAVKCLKCKYTWFSASELCKSEGHPIKVVDAEKRFFKCGKCNNRTVSLSIIPLISCKSCGSSNWVKAAMIKDKINTTGVQLSIRGGEQKFINSQVTDTNLDLLVAED